MSPPGSDGGCHKEAVQCLFLGQMEVVTRRLCSVSSWVRWRLSQGCHNEAVQCLFLSQMEVVTRLSQGGCAVSILESDGGFHKMSVCYLQMTIISLTSS